jgi:protein pelota
VDAIRINGINVKENKWIGMNIHQSLEIRGGGKPIQIIKTKFDHVHVKRLEEAASESNVGQILAIVMEEGLAHICLVSRKTLKLKEKIQKNISKAKKGLPSKKQNQTNSFHE